MRLILIISIAGTGIFTFIKNLNYTSFFFLVVFVLLFIELFNFIKNTYLFYDKTIMAMLNNDFSADFSKHSDFENYKNLFKLYDVLKSREHEQLTKDVVYRSILDNIETGVLILHKASKEWEIFQMNEYFSTHFQVPKLSKWNYLKNYLPSLCNIIEERSFQDFRISVQIRTDTSEHQTYMLQTSKTVIFEQEYYIILLDSIQKIIAKKEKDAWINLMKVISHELMNSITPIRSLTQSLNEFTQQDALSTEDIEDMKNCVNTMIHRSDHLQNFIESYRKLAMLPTPNKERVELSTLINNSLSVMVPLLKKAEISITTTITNTHWIMGDANQLEQVIINLITNSIYALKNSQIKEINIITQIKNNRNFIIISDTGHGVDKEIEDKIFLPFFTTRSDGAGIGLTLSKNIIEAHGGYLNFKNFDKSTSFTICLI
ncbi:sensor histidine kinase [Flavobacterium rhizosphaerae]|uniref:histidine kinase n=1 Tax=Flavobacterium rhizosphaerae TaxID=3163298 RepID=A0ABW8YX13_9FLAO